MASVQEDIERHARRLCRILERREGDNLVSFVLYGSVARGQATRGSDLDVLIVFEKLPEDRRRRWEAWDEAQQEAREEEPFLAGGQAFDIEPVVKSRQGAKYHSPLYLDMTLDAKLLFDRGGFFEGVLEEMRARMRELGSKRVFLDNGGWYWDLKPDRKPGENIEI